jgi:hypothetical protein
MAYENEVSPVSPEFGDLNDRPIFDEDGDMTEEEWQLLQALGLVQASPMAGAMEGGQAPSAVASSLLGSRDSAESEMGIEEEGGDQVVVESNPYRMERRGGQSVVVKAATGEVVPGGTHASDKEALAHLAALEANVHHGE